MSQRVIIVGAGAAGLAAARQLADSGLKPVIVEASSRLGGRIHTFTSWGPALDMGAAWVHEHPHNPLSPYFTQKGEDMYPTDFTNPHEYLAGGQKNSATQIKARNRVQFGYLGLATELAEQNGWEISLEEALRRIPPGSSPKKRHERLGEARALKLYVGDMKLVPARRGEDFAVPEEIVPTDFWPRNGYQPWIKSMAEGLEVVLDWPVTEVLQTSDEITLRGPQGSMKADAVVVTLPLGVLKKNEVRFTPPLSAPKVAAIETLGMTVQNKCFLRFPQVFWPADRDCLNFWRPPLEPASVRSPLMAFIDFSRRTGEPVLMGIVRDAEAESWDTLEDAEILDSILAPLRVAFGSTFCEPTDYQITRWGPNPYARGGFTFLPWPASPENFSKLGQAEGRLFFAGEATSKENCGTVHGAYLSGQRAATEVADFLAAL